MRAKVSCYTDHLIEKRTFFLQSEPSRQARPYFSVLVKSVSVDFYLLPRSVNEVWPLTLYIHWYSAGG